MNGENIENMLYDFNSQTNANIPQYYPGMMPSNNNNMNFHQEGGNYRRNSEEEHEGRYPVEREENVSGNTNMSSFLEMMFEGEKPIRTLEMEIQMAKMRKDMLLGFLEQSNFEFLTYFYILLFLEKKQMESIKSENKKLKMNNDKFKDNITQLSREIEFLQDMILLSTSKASEN